MSKFKTQSYETPLFKNEKFPYPMVLNGWGNSIGYLYGIKMIPLRIWPLECCYTKNATG